MSFKVLICDRDTEAMRPALAVLEKRGCLCLAVGGPLECLDAVRSWSPDLVLLGADLPNGGALSVLKSIRSCVETENLAVIVVAEYVEEEDVWRAYHAGADLYVEKPVDPEQLLRLVHG
jgi:two-component system chemotaxis response regulator CheY